MTEIELNNEYFEWMCQLVCNERYSRRLSYQKLLRHLHNIIPMEILAGNLMIVNHWRQTWVIIFDDTK